MSHTFLRESGPEGAAALDRHAASLEHHYIVGLHEHATNEHVEGVKAHARAVARAKHGTDEGHVEFRHAYSRAFRGFSARLSPEVREELARHADVRFVVPDRALYPAQSTQNAFFPTATPAPDWSTILGPAPWSADVSPWHLDRLDGSRPLDGKYQRGSKDGAGVDIYVLDTGIFTDQLQYEFGARVIRLYDVDAPSLYMSSSPNWAVDCSPQSHGTAVASVAAGATLGAAPGATILALKVFARSDRSNPSSTCLPATSDSNVIAGMEAAITSINSRGTGRTPVVLVGVASAALSGGDVLAVNPAYTDVVTRLRAAGAVVVTAAGNDAVDGCTAMPGNTANVINVGASDQDDYRAGFSNWGACVSLFAPGQNIAAAMKPYDVQGFGFNSPECCTTVQGFAANQTVMHGTSFSAALAAGVVALYRSANSALAVAAVESAVKSGALQGTLMSSSLKTNSPDRLLSLKNLALPGFVSTVGSPAYNASLIQATISGCSSRRDTFVNKPSDLQRYVNTYSTANWFEMKPVYSWSQPPPAGVFVARLRVEEDRMNFRATTHNYTERPSGDMFIYLGSPNMPSFSRLPSYSTYAFPETNAGSPFILKAGTYYILVQRAYDYSSGRASGAFRLDVSDDSCTTPPGSELVSDGMCSALELHGCGLGSLTSTMQNSQSLATPSAALVALATQTYSGGTVSEMTGYGYRYYYRNIVVRVNLPAIPISSGSSLSMRLQFECGSNKYECFSAFLLYDGCPTSPRARPFAFGPSTYDTPLFTVFGTRAILAGSYYLVVIIRNLAYSPDYAPWPPAGPFYTGQNVWPLHITYSDSSICAGATTSLQTPAACSSATQISPLPYCGTIATSLRNWPVSIGGNGRQAIFQLANLNSSRRDTRISLCSPTADFVSTLYLYSGCPGSTTATLIKQAAGCSLTLSEYYSLPYSTLYYVIVEGTLTSSQTGAFTLSASDADCGGAPATPAPTPAPAGSGSGSGSDAQCFPYAAPTTYYTVQCPAPMTVTRLERVFYNGAYVCGARVPDLKRFLFADWSSNITLTQSPAADTALLPAVPQYPSNGAWTSAGLPTSGTGATQVQFTIGNTSGRGPRGNCTFTLTVVDQDGPMAQAVCPPTSQEVTVAPNQCTVDAPDLRPQVSFDSTCMRQASGPSTLTQSIAPGTQLLVGETYAVRLYSSSYPSGAACDVRLTVRRATSPQHAPGPAVPASIAAVSGGRPALVPVSLRYTFADSCADHAKACKLAVRQTGDAAASTDGRLVLSGAPYGLWNQTCASDLAAIQLSPYMDPSFAGASGAAVRTYSVMITCSYGFGVQARLAWEVPVLKP